MSWFFVDAVVSFVVILFLVVSVDGEVLEFLNILLVHLLEFSD